MAPIAPLRHLLRDERLLKEFHGYDRIARRSKAAFLRWGKTTVVLALLSLFLAATAKFWDSPTRPLRPWIPLLCGLPGLAAIAIAFWMTRIKRFSRHWLVALFFRERLRQWHFQKFLDG